MTLFDILVTVSLLLWILVCLAGLVFLIAALPTLRRLEVRMDRADRLMDLLDARLAPLLDRTERTMEDARYVAAVLRSDVDAASRAFGRAAGSVERMVEMAEERAVELNGLLKVAQEEAEETFLSTASLLRALRSLGGGGRRPRLGQKLRRRLG